MVRHEDHHVGPFRSLTGRLPLRPARTVGPLRSFQARTAEAQQQGYDNRPAACSEARAAAYIRQWRFPHGKLSRSNASVSPSRAVPAHPTPS